MPSLTKNKVGHFYLVWYSYVTMIRFVFPVGTGVLDGPQTGCTIFYGIFENKNITLEIFGVHDVVERTVGDAGPYSFKSLDGMLGYNFSTDWR